MRLRRVRFHGEIRTLVLALYLVLSLTFLFFNSQEHKVLCVPDDLSFRSALVQLAHSLAFLYFYIHWNIKFFAILPTLYLFD